MSKIYDALQKHQREPKTPREDERPPVEAPPPAEPPPSPPVARDPGDDHEPSPPRRKLTLPSLDDHPQHFWDAVARVASAIQTSERRKGSAVLFTGVVGGAGVSTVALGVASLLVRDPGIHVLLIDAHARPDRDALLPMGTSGLIQLGSNKASLHEIVVDTDLRGLSFAPRGAGSYNGPKLFEAVIPLFADLRSRYDYLIIDSAPVLGAPETAVLAAACDGVVVVVDAERTPKAEAVRTRTVLEQHKALLIGTVVNRVRRTGLFGTR